MNGPNPIGGGHRPTELTGLARLDALDARARANPPPAPALHVPEPVVYTFKAGQKVEGVPKGVADVIALGLAQRPGTTAVVKFKQRAWQRALEAIAGVFCLTANTATGAGAAISGGGGDSGLKGVHASGSLIGLACQKYVRERPTQKALPDLVEFVDDRGEVTHTQDVSHLRD